MPGSSPTSLDSAPSSSSLENGNLTPNAFIQDFQKMHQETMQIVQVVLAILKIMAGLMSYPALILLRRNLGERVLSSVAFLTTWFILGLVAVASGVSLAYLLVVGLPVVYGIHTLKVKLRNNKGVRYYSYCRGDSWFDLILPRQEQLNRGGLEPAILLFAGVAVHLYSDALMLAPETTGVRSEPLGAWVCSAYFAAMGLGLFFVEGRLKRQERNTLLDHIDQQIIGSYFSSELDEQKEVVDEGFAVAELADWSQHQKQDFATNLGLPMFRRDAADDDGAPSESLWNQLLDPLPNSTPASGG